MTDEAHTAADRQRQNIFMETYAFGPFNIGLDIGSANKRSSTSQPNYAA